MYIPGIRGYFGPVKYYRFGSEEVKCSIFMSRILLFWCFITVCLNTL